MKRENKIQWTRYMKKFKFIIDKQCINTLNEFQAYSYKQLKDGSYTEDFVDRDNHCIDAIRYALSLHWGQSSGQQLSYGHKKKEILGW